MQSAPEMMHSQSGTYSHSVRKNQTTAKSTVPASKVSTTAHCRLRPQSCTRSLTESAAPKQIAASATTANGQGGPPAMIIAPRFIYSIICTNTVHGIVHGRLLRVALSGGFMKADFGISSKD